jgi:hypothetical protein
MPEVSGSGVCDLEGESRICPSFFLLIIPLTVDSRSYLNQWTQPDPVIPQPDNPQSLNRYMYVLGNPIRYNDPSGHNYCDLLNNNNLEDCTSGEQRTNSIRRSNIPSWDQSDIGHVRLRDISLAEGAYISFTNNPLKFAEYFVNPKNAPLEYDALEAFASYSTLHTTSDQLILSYIAAGYGVSAAERIQNARLNNLEAYLSNSGKLLTAGAAVSAMVIPLGLGSTGRTTPLTLDEQLAMEQVMSDPLSGATQLQVNMTDSRWPGSEGWEKWANNINGVEVHFVYNPLTGEFDDFKYK